MEQNITQSPAEREWLDMDAMAAVYPWPRATLYAWRHKGIGPPSVRAGRRVLYRRSDVEKWLADQMEAERSDVGRWSA
jgi:predicted DNA-binding transcriptional regulator AlpA